MRILLAKIVIVHAFLYRQISIESSEGRDTSQTTLAEHGFLFVEQLSKNLFCPVTHDLLLQPHLTACCGNHLSQEAAIRIQEEGGACPLCIESHLSTVLNKHFLRQVNELCVFCHHKERGCKWQGELSSLDHHLKSCSYYFSRHIKLLTCTIIILFAHIAKKRLLELNKTGQDIHYALSSYYLLI